MCLGGEARWLPSWRVGINRGLSIPSWPLTPSDLRELVATGKGVHSLRQDMSGLSVDIIEGIITVDSSQPYRCLKGSILEGI